MAGYFLPNSVRSKILSNTDDDEVRTLSPVFSWILNWNTSGGRTLVNDDGSIFILDLGFSEDYYLHTLSYSSDVEIDISKYNLSQFEGEIDFTTEGDLISVNPKSNHIISFSYWRFSSSSNFLMIREHNCEYSIDECDINIFGDSRLCVIATGTTDSSGVGTYLEFFSFTTPDDTFEIEHTNRVKLPHNKNHVNVFGCDTWLYFCSNATKLLLLINRYDDEDSDYEGDYGLFVVTYSLIRDSFGPVYELDNSSWNNDHCVFFYLYHKDLGSALLICQPNGVLQLLREDSLLLSPSQKGDINLKEYLPNVNSFRFKQMDSFERIIIYIEARNVLYLFDYLAKSVVAKFIPSEGYTIFTVLTNWTGEEIYVRTVNHRDDEDDEDESNQRLDILVSNKTNQVASLKYLSKIAAFQSYSVEELTQMDIPKTLKRDMKLLF